jgi:starch phosphorylase
VLNLSTLDGWWPEACEHGVNGWQFGDGFESSKESVLDKNDLKGLYKVLLEEVIPTYYRSKKKWIEMMRQSILSTEQFFSVKRMLEEYYGKMYIQP